MWQHLVSACTRTYTLCVLCIYTCVDGNTYFLEFRSHTKAGKAPLTEDAVQWTLFGLGPLSVLVAAPAAGSLRKCWYNDVLEVGSVCVTVCNVMQIHADACWIVCSASVQQSKVDNSICTEAPCGGNREKRVFLSRGSVSCDFCCVSWQVGGGREKAKYRFLLWAIGTVIFLFFFTMCMCYHLIKCRVKRENFLNMVNSLIRSTFIRLHNFSLYRCL